MKHNRLESERLQANIDLAAIDLELGRHAEILPDLKQLVAAHPLREDLYSHLMLALYRAGRQAEALETFQQIQRLLHDELGIDPGPALQELQKAILCNAPELLLPSSHAAAVPRGLPPDVPGFTGRAQQVATLDEAFQAEVPLVLITGGGGVGKSALAIRWAHQHTAHFPDGQLFVDVRGYAAGSQVRPIEAISRFLHALGVAPQRIPVELADATAMFRSLVADRQMLIILDNTRSAADVRHLLPGSKGCLTLVTSRDRLTGLIARDGAVRVPLDVLESPDAERLIVDLLGRVAKSAEPAQVGALAKACAYLPLALRIAVAQLLEQPHQTIDSALARLRERGRLEALSVPGDELAAVRNTFALSLESVPPPAQLVFRRLGLVPCPDYTPDTAAALAGLAPDQAAAALEILANAHLVAPIANGRYELHDLLRDFAAEICQVVDDTIERSEAVARLRTWYLHRCRAAAYLLYPALIRLPNETVPEGAVFTDPAQAVAWLDSEHRNMTAIMSHALSAGENEFTWQLAHSLRAYYESGRHLVSWFAAARSGLIAARRADSSVGKAAMYRVLAAAQLVIGRYKLAAANTERSATESQRSGWCGGNSAALVNLGVARARMGRPADAVAPLKSAIDGLLRSSEGTLWFTASTNLINVLRYLGDLRSAADCGARALELYGSNPDESRHRSFLLQNLATVHYLTGRLVTALDTFRDHDRVLRRFGHLPSVACGLGFKSLVLLDLGRYAEAEKVASETVDLAREIDDNEGLALGLTALGSCHLAAAEVVSADAALQEAVAVASDHSDLHQLVAALTVLARCQLAAGDPAEAERSVRRALAQAQESQFRLLEGRALVVLARIRLADGDSAEAATLAEEAATIQQETGHLLGEAEAHAVHAKSEPDPDVAAAHAASARRIYAETDAVPPPELSLP